MYLTTGEAAKMCGVNLNTIKLWIRNGKIRAIRTPGGHWRIPRDEFLKFLRSFNATPHESETEPSTSRHLLIIDDDKPTHSLIASALEPVLTGYAIHSAYDGYSGLIEIGQLRPELIFLDIMMPEINGLEIIHRLKSEASPVVPPPKIIAITAASDRRLVVNKLREAEPDAIMFKPLDINCLQDFVKRLLRNESLPLFGTALGL